MPERDGAAQQHLRVRAQPPGERGQGAAGEPPPAGNTPRSSLSPFPLAQMLSHEVTLAEGQGSQGVTRAGEGAGEGLEEINSPSPGASAHISLGLVSVAGERKGFVSQKAPL